MLNGKVVFEGHTNNGTSVLVRYPQYDDLHAMWQFINTISAERTFILMQGIEISLEDERRYLDNRLQQIDEGTLVQLGVFSGNTLVANAEIARMPGVQYHVGNLGISVIDGYRGQGIGALLLELLIKEAEAQFSGLHMIMLEVFGNNPIATNLYRKMGFVEYGRLANGIKHRDEFVDAVLMVKML